MISEAKAFWDPISGKVKDQIAKEMGNALQVQRYDVTTDPDGSVMGVTQPFGSNEIFLPYSKEVAGATVGDTVLVAWWGSMSNARVYYFAKGYDGGAGGGDAVIASITFPAAWTDSGNGYYTAAPTIDGVTLSAESKIDLQITAAQFLTLQADGVENLYVENNNAALTAYSVGGYPSAEITLQCTITGTQAPTPPRNPSLDMVYPIGSIYMNVANVNPGNTIGGTWERIEAEKAETIFGPLWSNPDPLAQFAAQTVTLEDNDAERFMFVIHERIGDPAQNNNVGPTFILKPGDVSVISTNVCNFPGSYIYTRQVTSITQTTVTFGQGGYTGVGTVGSSSASRNDLCIPFEIYGIKKVSPFNGMYAWKRTA